MGPVRLDRRGPVAILTLDRAERRNPLGQNGDGEAFEAACREINDDKSVRCAVITGSGSSFSAGGDVKAMRGRSGEFGGAPFEIRDSYRRHIHRMLRALAELETPLIAAVNGPAIGLGCGVACLADIRIASEKARFGVTFLKLGLIPGDGGAWTLPRLIGYSRAAQLLFTGELIDAETALAWGLVSEVTSEDELLATALDLADRIAVQPPQALRMAKMLLRQGRTSTFDQMLELAAGVQPLMHHTEDHLEGLDALAERRPPQFLGR